MSKLIIAVSKYIMWYIITPPKTKNSGIGKLAADTLIKYFGPRSKRG